MVKGIADQVISAVCGPAKKVNYPAGSVTAQNPTTKVWIVIAPKGATVVALKDAFGEFGAVAGVDETKKYVQVGASTTKPEGISTISWETLQKLLKGPWYLRPSTWIIAGVGAVALGGGTYYAVKRAK